ncbi:MAG: HEAT repeat [Candidatus Methanocomedens sp.]|nr:MAG: HEAT repeat [ANME-2 cluster archaeon]
MNSQRIDTLISQLHDLSSDKPDEQFKAAIALGDVTDANALNRVMNELVKALSTKQALTRAHAAEALGKLKYPKAVPYLIGALNDDYQLVRSYAARALGKIGDPIAIEQLVHTLGNDPFFGARAEAAEALRNLCPDARTAICEKARQTLQIYREVELKRNDERSRRVLAEMDISLKEIREIIIEYKKAIKEGKTDIALALERKLDTKINLAQDKRDAMGGLLASRVHISEF